jgi:hypothetical protein
MRVLNEDSHRLVFNVYPTVYYLLFQFSLLLLLLIYPTGGYYGYSYIFYLFHLSNNLQMIISYILAIIIAVQLVMSYLYPIHVVIDRMAGVVTYRYFDPFGRYKFEPLSFISVKTLQINSLSHIEYTNKVPEWSGYPSYILGKYSFILKDKSPAVIDAGPFSMFPHKYACEKIAKYLHIPYGNKVV